MVSNTNVIEAVAKERQWQRKGVRSGLPVVTKQPGYYTLGKGARPGLFI